MTTSKTFWDGAHQRNSKTRLGATPAQAYYDYFNKVGPFTDDLKASQSILDIGPGRMNYLMAQSSKKRYAIDISSVSRDKARAIGADAYAPGEIGEDVVDLATCLSVVQHCDEKEVGMIFADVSRALRPGGLLYINGVYTGRDNCNTPSEILRKSARFSYDSETICNIASDCGLTFTDKYEYKLGGLGVWIIRATIG